MRFVMNALIRVAVRVAIRVADQPWVPGVLALRT